jgi:hypothetical protein
MAHSKAELKNNCNKNILFEIILDRKRTGQMFTVGFTLTPTCIQDRNLQILKILNLLAHTVYNAM